MSNERRKARSAATAASAAKQDYIPYWIKTEGKKITRRCDRADAPAATPNAARLARMIGKAAREVPADPERIRSILFPARIPGRDLESFLGHILMHEGGLEFGLRLARALHGVRQALEGQRWPFDELPHDHPLSRSTIRRITAELCGGTDDPQAEIARLQVQLDTVQRRREAAGLKKGPEAPNFLTGKFVERIPWELYLYLEEERLNSKNLTISDGLERPDKTRLWGIVMDLTRCAYPKLGAEQTPDGVRGIFSQDSRRRG